MSGDEFRELELSISKVRRTSKLLKHVCVVVFTLFSVTWAILLGAVAFGFVKGQSSEVLRDFLYILLSGLVIDSLLFIAMRSFSDIASGMSPFTLKQASRFRIAGMLLLGLAIIEAVLSVSFSVDFQLFGTDFGVRGSTEAQQPQLDINIMMVLFSVMLFGIAVLFRHGALLQRLSDETE